MGVSVNNLYQYPSYIHLHRLDRILKQMEGGVDLMIDAK